MPWYGKEILVGWLIALPISGTIKSIMKKTLNIKNMVCDRCKSTVLRELEELGCDIKTVELGQIVLNKKTGIQTLELEKVLSKHGFEIIKDETEILIEEIKIALIKKIENQDNANLSSFLTKRFNNYSYTKNKTVRRRINFWKFWIVVWWQNQRWKPTLSSVCKVFKIYKGCSPFEIAH